MNEIYFIKHETSFGPFFSTQEKAIKYMSKRYEKEQIKGIIEKTDPYISLEKVILDEESYFDS